MDILLRNVKILDRNSPFHNSTSDILIVEGKIQSVGKTGEISSDNDVEVIEMNGCSVSPGWMDMRCFSGEPGNEARETFDSLEKAAANGGFTDVLIYPNTTPVIDNAAVAGNIKYLSSESAITVHYLGALTKGFDGKSFTDMIDLSQNGALGFTDVGSIQNSNTIQLGLQYVKAFGGVILNQPLDANLSAHKMVSEGVNSTKLGLPGIPEEAEIMMLERDLRLLEYTGSRLHVSGVTTAKAVELIKEAKTKGLDVTCDVAAHYLELSDDVLEHFDANHKVMPPLRNLDNVKALRKAVKAGDIDVVVSDHTPWNLEAKEVEFDRAEYGISAIETVFPVLNQYVDDVLDPLVYNPRKILGVDVPVIDEGQEAVLTLFSEDDTCHITSSFLQSRGKNSPFIGQEFSGSVKGIVNKGVMMLFDS